ncbi:hypothetical protein B0H16DRAFT_1575033 [Mycena metata]|uniref:Uncharacterized protein n=1 Tax=Mycena metata TaxID=1033252 RepID=A0AAD7I686_9AGAR|nr:hypothetical protein B0H16DRAFT_1575033 [Mycena metata]
MEKHKSETRRPVRMLVVLAHFCDPDHLNSLRNIDVGNEEELNAFKLKFDSFFSQVLQLVSSKHREVENNNRLGTATHRQKRSLVYSLELQQPSKSIDDILAENPLDQNAPRGSLQNPYIIWRKRNLSFGPGLRTVLADTHCRPYLRDFVCNEAAGFYICDINESAVFLDHLPSENDSEVLVPTPTLVVLYGVFGAGYPESAVFLAWLKNVVDVAVQQRRDVRPDAPGKMVQVGFNTGPRHARVWMTPPKSNINDIIAATTTVWAAAKTWLPTDITHRIDHKLEKHSMPRSATRNVKEGILFFCGTGFVLGLNGVTYSFPDVQRAPPEAYLTVDYPVSLHLDPCYADGACAISVNADRTIDPPLASLPVDTFSTAGGTSITPSMSSRPSTRVVVKQATGTLFAFDPTFRHGTTHLCGAHNCTITIGFSAQIQAAFEHAKNGFHESGVGAGDGNCLEFVHEKQ